MVSEKSLADAILVLIKQTLHSHYSNSKFPQQVSSGPFRNVGQTECNREKD